MTILSIAIKVVAGTKRRTLTIRIIGCYLSCPDLSGMRKMLKCCLDFEFIVLRFKDTSPI